MTVTRALRPRYAARTAHSVTAKKISVVARLLATARTMAMNRS
jgi:hypothetical protein